MCVVLGIAEDLSSSECRRRPQTLTCWSCRCAVPRSDLTAHKWLGPGDTMNRHSQAFSEQAPLPLTPMGAAARWELKQDHRAFMTANGTWKQVEWTLSCTWALVCHLSPLRSMPNSTLASLQDCPLLTESNIWDPLLWKAAILTCYGAKTHGLVRCMPDLILFKRNCTRGLPVNSRVYFPNCYSGPVNPSTAVPLRQWGRG